MGISALTELAVPGAKGRDAMAAPAAVGAGAGQGKEYPGELTLYVLLTCAVAATWGPYRRLRHRHIR